MSRTKFVCPHNRRFSFCTPAVQSPPTRFLGDFRHFQGFSRLFVPFGLLRPLCASYRLQHALVLDTPVLPQAAGLPLALYLFFSGGCTVQGVCGKTAPVANLQDELTAALVGLARALDVKGHTKEGIDYLMRGLFMCVTKCPTGMVQTYVAAEKLEQAGKKLGVDLSVETQGAMGIQNQFSPEQIDEADYIVIAADVAIDEASRFGNKKLYVTSLEDAIVHPEQILESLTTKSYSYQDAAVSNKKILG